MKIGFVRRGYSATGGAEAYVRRLAEALVPLGHVPVLITTGQWPAECWVSNDIIRLPGKSPDEFADAFRASPSGCDLHLSLERVPGCEIFRAGDGVHAAWLERRTRFEPFWKRATRWMNPKHAQLMRLERAVFDPNNTRAIIANSHLIRNEILERFSFPADRIHVIHNGLKCSSVTPDRAAARRQYGVPDDAFCALFVGTGWNRKGLDTAVRAVERTGKTTLLVAGRGPAKQFASPSVKFLGPMADLSNLHAAADLFVLPTWYDAFSNACLEALAAGLPVITTPANGFSEIIEPGVHGAIVQEGDVAGFALELEAWRGPCAAARPACRALAAQFSIERNTNETLAVIASISPALTRSNTSSLSDFSKPVGLKKSAG